LPLNHDPNISGHKGNYFFETSKCFFRIIFFSTNIFCTGKNKLLLSEIRIL